MEELYRHNKQNIAEAEAEFATFSIEVRTKALEIQKLFYPGTVESFELVKIAKIIDK